MLPLVCSICSTRNSLLVRGVLPMMQADFKYRIRFNRETRQRTCVLDNGNVYYIHKGNKSGTWYVNGLHTRNVAINGRTMRDVIIGILILEGNI